MSTKIAELVEKNSKPEEQLVKETKEQEKTFRYKLEALRPQRGVHCVDVVWIKPKMTAVLKARPKAWLSTPSA